MRKSEIVFVLVAIGCFSAMTRFAPNLSESMFAQKGEFDPTKKTNTQITTIRRAKIKVIRITGPDVVCMIKGHKMSFSAQNPSTRAKLKVGGTYFIDYNYTTALPCNPINTFIYKVY